MGIGTLVLVLVVLLRLGRRSARRSTWNTERGRATGSVAICVFAPAKLACADGLNVGKDKILFVVKATKSLTLTTPVGAREINASARASENKRRAVVCCGDCTWVGTSRALGSGTEEAVVVDNQGTQALHSSTYSSSTYSSSARAHE